jgi:hypothetical protein
VTELDRLEIEGYLGKIKDCLPKGYEVLLVADNDNPLPRSWITLGDMDLSHATSVINNAMVQDLLPDKPDTEGEDE